MILRKSLVVLIAAAVVGMLNGTTVLGQSMAHGHPYEIPSWTDAQAAADGFYSHTDGGEWTVGRTNQGGALFTTLDSGDENVNLNGPSYDAGNSEWSWLNPGITSNSGNARFDGNSLSTDGIINQFPRPMLIFRAPLDGVYGVAGTATFNWAADDQGGAGIANPSQISQLRFDVSTWAGSPAGPKANFGSKTTLAHNGTLGAVQASGTHTADLSAVAELQGIALNEGDFIGIRSGNRGLLSLDANLGVGTAVFDTMTMDLSGVTITPEPASLALLGLGGLALLRRRR
jgi:hypothetical protein